MGADEFSATSRMIRANPLAHDNTTLVEWAQVVGALAGVVIAGLVAFMPYVRRPKLTIKEDLAQHPRVEVSDMGGLPACA